MAKRQRNIQLHFMVSDHERELIKEKMAQFGTDNMGAYIRKIAIDGYIVKLELPELAELTALLRRYNANLNQIAKRVNETSRIYAEDLEDISQQQEKIWQGVHGLLTKLSAL
ncbi:plasmid mobilization relaxosome protein MobC [Christensenellaceae bacterium OttesenSCG-928-M15]|nr:plasmid mobilization relaxosome protein MobC [Christensenellaceae bacterium OttesenSCG-928-M15]